MSKVPIYSFQSKGFIGNPLASIVMATAVGMCAMFVSIAAGGPILLSVIALLGGILLVYSFRTGEVTYELYDDGIRMLMISSLTRKRGGKPADKFYKWSDILSYKTDKDLGRNMQTFEYLKLYLKKNPGEIWINDRANREGFQKFKEGFMEIVEEKKASYKVAEPKMEQNTGNDGSVKENSVPGIPGKSGPLPVRKKTFYQTIFAKIFTLFMLFLCGGILYYGAQYGMRTSNWYKLAAVLVPGTIYMVYRVFFSSKRNEN